MKPDDIFYSYGVYPQKQGYASVAAIKHVAHHIGTSHVATYWTTGLGKSALVAQKCAGTANSLGLRSQFIHPVDGLHGDTGSWRVADTLIAISASGETEEVLAVVRHALTAGMTVVALTSDHDSSLGELAHQTLLTLPPEVDIGHIPAGSFASACAVADALVVGLAGESATVTHPGGAIGKALEVA